MPSGKAPALDRFPLKFINSLDWIMPYFVISSLQEEDKEDGDNAATSIPHTTDLTNQYTVWIIYIPTLLQIWLGKKCNFEEIARI